MNKKRTQKVLLLLALIALPTLALAQSSVTTSVTSGLNQFGIIINALTSNVVRAISTLFATLAMVAFFYGIVQYIWGIREGDEGRVQKGNVFLRWGLVALFVMFSVWGIVIYVQRIFGIETNNTIIIPQIQLQNGGTANNSNPLNGNGTGGAGGGSGSGAVATSCASSADGTSCTLPSGASGACGSNDEGTRGCYATAGGGAGGTCSGLTENQRIACLRNTPCPDSSQVRDDAGACVSATNY
ncbi:MAG: pilin [Candidatus Paceibacterota bacterium]